MNFPHFAADASAQLAFVPIHTSPPPIITGARMIHSSGSVPSDPLFNALMGFVVICMVVMMAVMMVYVISDAVRDFNRWCARREEERAREERERKWREEEAKKPKAPEPAFGNLDTQSRGMQNCAVYSPQHFPRKHRGYPYA